MQSTEKRRMKQQLVSIGILLILIVITLSGCVEEKTKPMVINTYTSAEDALNHLLYTNNQYHYGFNPPTRWCVSYVPGQEPGSVSLSNRDGMKAIYITPWEGDTEDTISKSVDTIINYQREHENNYTLISKTEKIINGMTTVEVVCTSDYVDKEMLVWMIKGNKSLYVTFSEDEQTFDTCISAINQSIESFYIFDEAVDLTLPHELKTRPVRTDDIGGAYDAHIFSYEVYNPESIAWCEDDDGWGPAWLINYTKEDHTYSCGFKPYLRNALNWTKENTSENCTILCWWDYGCMIEGYAERNAIAISPSPSLRDTIAPWGTFNEDEKENYIEKLGGWTSNETQVDIATMLTSPNITSAEIQELLHAYNISYIFTDPYDKQIACIMFYALNTTLDLPASTFFQDCAESAAKENSLIYQMWNETVNIPGLSLVYEDLPAGYNAYYMYGARIFKVDES